MDLDPLFGMPSFMPGYYNIEDGLFASASDGKLYVEALLQRGYKPFLKRRRRGCPKPHYERKRVWQLYEIFIL